MDFPGLRAMALAAKADAEMYSAPRSQPASPCAPQSEQKMLRCDICLLRCLRHDFAVHEKILLSNLQKCIIRIWFEAKA